jgi:uncharacterized membrane protein YfcA
LVQSLITEIGFSTIVLVVVLALITSAIHGATGVAGGFLLAAALAPIIGVKPLVPMISVALLISHSSRAILNARHFDRSAFFAICVPAVPCIIAAALLYGRLSAQIIAIALGVVVLASIPIRRWAKRRQKKVGRITLGSIGAVYGGLSGVSIGPGMLLVPFMLGHGLSRESFVATLAAIALVTNITRVSVYGTTSMLNEQYILLGIIVGLITIPGNWIGRSVLRRITNKGHAIFVDILTIIGAFNFFWLALR